MLRSYKKTTAGFTLIELLVVITIIGLLASVVLATLSSSRALARDATRVATVKELQKALELYRNANGGNYPCATTMPGCASGGGGQVNVNGASTTLVFNNAIRPYFTPPIESFVFLANPNFGSIIYRTGGTTGVPILNSYTIALRRERAVTKSDGSTIAAEVFCKVQVGTSSFNFNSYPNCF